ncbi:MAG: hypothetical protein KAS32_24630 [Candidatus Peribacteraceae bacterium]|nr:hypothetical protein [Candidatus Peribacteraceae bacterium]
MALEALFDCVVIKMEIPKSDIVMTAEARGQAYADAEKTVSSVGDAVKGIEVGDKLVVWPSVQPTFHEDDSGSYLIIRAHEILAKVID